jgi:uncharacterized membrane protein
MVHESAPPCCLALPFMLLAHLRGDPREIARVAHAVVLADFLFTASAVILSRSPAHGWPRRTVTVFTTGGS